MKFAPLGLSIIGTTMIFAVGHANAVFGQTNTPPAATDSTPAATTTAIDTTTPTEGTPTQTQTSTKIYNETPQAFLQRFFDARQKVKSAEQLKEYFIASNSKAPDMSSLNEAQKKQAFGMVEAFYAMGKTYLARKAVVVSSQKQGLDLLVLTKSREMINDGAKTATYDISGKYVLRKGATTWQIVSEEFNCTDGKGFTMSTGAPSSKATAAAAATPKDVYEKAVSKALDLVWKPSATSSGTVTAELQNTANGAFRIISVTDKTGLASAEEEVKAMLSKLRLPPLPPNIDTPIVNIQWIWSPDKLPMQALQFFKSSFTVSQPTLMSSTGKPTTTINWVNDGKNDAFKQQPFGGNLEGAAVKFTKAVVGTTKDGWELTFRPSEAQKYPCVRVRLRTSADIQGKTLYLPMPEVPGQFGPDPGSYFSRHTGQSSVGTSEGFAGRIQFGKWNKGMLSGYFTIRIASSNMKSSAINGYFYATKDPDQE